MSKLDCLFKINEMIFLFFYMGVSSNALRLLSIIDRLQPLINLLRLHPTMRRRLARANRITRIPTRHPTPPPRSRIGSIPRNRHKRRSPSPRLILRILKLLRKGRSFSQNGTFEVDDVDGDDEDEGDAEEDGARVCEMVFAADVGEEGGSGDGEDAGEEVARPAVAAGGGGGVGAVGGNHVVDCGHVDGVVGDADDGCEDGGADPVEWWAGAGPCKADETNWEAGGGPEEEVEAGFVLGFFVVGFRFAFFDVASDGGDEGEPGDEVAD